MEILSADKLDSIIRELRFEDRKADKYEDPELRKFISYVDVLYQIETGDFKNRNPINEEDFFYSRYYWFNKFVKKYIQIYGPNAGLEQQLFKMLEHYYEYSGVREVDWNIIEQIENGTI
jgi:hypothetical protein